MNDQTQIFFNELIKDSAAQAENHMFKTMLTAVHKKRNIRTAIRMSSVIAVTVLGIWLFQLVNQTPHPVEYVNQSKEAAVEYISASPPTIEFIQTSDAYGRFMAENEAIIKQIDDNDLLQIIRDHAYAVVDSENSGGSILLLLNSKVN